MTSFVVRPALEQYVVSDCRIPDSVNYQNTYDRPITTAAVTDQRPTRRTLLRASGIAAVTGLAGCTDRIVGGGEPSIQDSDGDGVIDSEDYAPRDPSVQWAEQVREKGATTRSDQDSPTGTEPPQDTPPGTPADGPVAEPDLVSRWTFRSGFEDEVGGHDGAVVNGAPTVGTFGGRPAVAFEESDAVRISRGGHGELSRLCSDCGPSSFSMWVYFDAQAGDGGTWDGRDRPTHTLLKNDTGYRFVGRPADGSGVELRFSISDFGDSAASGYGLPDGTSITVPTGEWHHFGATVEPGSSVTLYVDGEERFSDGSMDGYSDPNRDFWSDVTVGSAYGSNPERWVNTLHGKLSDVRIYATGLSDDEMGRIYANTR